MAQVKETLIGFYIGLGLYTVFVEVVGLFFAGDVLSYTLGLLFGAVVAAFLIIHMAKTLDKALDLLPEQAEKYVKRQSFFRLFIMLVVLVISLTVRWLSFITVVLGLLGCKMGALLAPVFLKKMYPDDFVTKHLE